jgi:hypothetical protein
MVTAESVFCQTNPVAPLIKNPVSLGLGIISTPLT